MHASVYLALTQYLKSTSRAVFKQHSWFIHVFVQHFLGREWFVYLDCTHKVSVLPHGFKQSNLTYWLADAFWGCEQNKMKKKKMEIKGEAFIIYTHALDDLVPIILVWNQLV